MNSESEAQLRVIRLVHTTLGGRGIRWWLFGGWALDALLGGVTRDHGDIEFWVERKDADAVVDALIEVGAVVLDTQPIEESREYLIGDVMFSSRVLRSSCGRLLPLARALAGLELPDRVVRGRHRPARRHDDPT